MKTKQTLQNTLHAKRCAKRELKARYSISGPFSVYKKTFLKPVIVVMTAFATVSTCDKYTKTKKVIA